MIEEKRPESPSRHIHLGSLPEGDSNKWIHEELESERPESVNKTDININKAPGDFVVVHGQAYKISKTTPSSDVIPTDSSVHHSPEIMAFKEALQNAETKVSKQTEDLKKQSNRIDDLEQFILQNAEKLGGLKALKGLGLDNVSLRESGSNLIGSGGRPRLGLAARRRAESLKSGVYELNVNTATSPSIDEATTNDTPSVSAYSEMNDTSTSLNGVNKGGTEDDISPISAGNNFSHDLITPVAADTGELRERNPSFSDIVENVERVKTSPPVIRRSYSDGQYSSPSGRLVGDENTELDSNYRSISRNLTDSAKKEKDIRKQQAELVIVSGLAADASPARAPPKGLAARLSMGSQERRKLNERKRQNSSDNLRALDSGTLSRDSKTPGSAGSERSMDIANSRASSANSITSASRNTRSTSPAFTTTFQWSGQGDPEAAPHLFVAHDNPQLGQTVTSKLRTSTGTVGSSNVGSNNSDNSNSSPSSGMGFMLESKDESGLTVFVTGIIKYSGPFEAIEGSTADGDMARGSQCLVGVDMVGYRVNMKAVPMRPRGELIEIDLNPSNVMHDDVEKSNTTDGTGGAVARVKLTSKSALKSLLKTCKGRVDLILDPYHTDNKWFPYWEGRRKMAPQFRSKGIGYLRLGDDMSNYGSAFLSLDAGATYLDDGASGAVASNASTPQNGTSSGVGSAGWHSFSRGNSGGSSRPNSNSDSFNSSGGRQLDAGSSSATPSSQGSFRGGEDVVPYTDDTHPHSRGNSAGSAGGLGGIALIHEFGGAALERQPASPSEEVAMEEELRDIITRLRDPDLKWADRTQYLQRLAEIGVNCAGASERIASVGVDNNNTNGIVAAIPSGDKVVMDTIAVIRDTLMKQNNPHVLKSALRCLPSISHGVRHRVTCAVAWKSLLLESIHLIRTVAKVCEEARTALDYMHSGSADTREQPSISLCQLCGHFEEIILGPRGKGVAGKGASNTCKVIQWLQCVASAELQASITALATLNTSQFSPSVYERVDVGMLLKKCKSTFQHREADTREAMVQLSSIFVTLDVLQVTTDANSFQDLATALSAANEGTREATLLKAISSSCASGLSEMKKHAPRVYAKTVIMSARQLQTSAEVLDSQITALQDMSKKERLPQSGNQRSPPSGKPGSATRGGNNKTPDGMYTSPGDRYFGGSRGSSRGGSVATLSSGLRGGTNGSTSIPATATTPRERHDKSLSSSPAQTDSTQAEQGQGTSPQTAPPSTGTTNIDLKKLQEDLSNCWYETRMILRVLPTTPSSWSSLVEVTQGSDAFITDLADAAQKASVTRATLLRAILPFDESTSSNDQSMVASPNAKAESILGKFSPKKVDLLREKAVGLRRTMRIKMADEADLRQAIAATEILRNFCAKVENVSSITKESAVQIINKLEGSI